MSKRKQRHIIKEQLIELEIEVYDDSEIRSIRENVLRVFQTEIGEALDKLCSEITPPMFSFI